MNRNTFRMKNLIWVILIFVAGCGLQKNVTIISTPPGASVTFENSSISGTTPYNHTFDFKKGQIYFGTLKKDSFVDYKFSFAYEPKEKKEYNFDLVKKTYVYTSKTMDLYGSGLIYNTVLADLDIMETKVIEKATFNNDGAIELAKSEAVAKALKKANNADIMIEPRFEINMNDKIVTVSGYPAKYKNFRNLKAEDVPLLKEGKLLSAPVNIYEPLFRNKEEKGKNIENKQQ